MLAASLSLPVVVLAVLGAVGVLYFEQPVRAAMSFLITVVAVAGLAHGAGAAVASGALLWLFGAAAGLLLLVTILLLNLTAEETGRRRYSVRGAIGLFVVAWLGAALFGVVLDEVALWPPRPRPGGPALLGSLFDEHGAALALTFIALAGAGIASLLVVRRRA